MSRSTGLSAVRAPWHFWTVGILSLLWNAFGAFDYTMTETRAEWYMGQFTPAQLAYFESFPSWAVAAWALGVWGGVLGSLLLLLRRRIAVWFFAASLIGLVITALYMFVLSNGMDVMGGEANLIFTAAIFVVAVALLLYASKMARRRVLRR